MPHSPSALRARLYGVCILFWFGLLMCHGTWHFEYVFGQADRSTILDQHGSSCDSSVEPNARN